MIGAYTSLSPSGVDSLVMWPCLESLVADEVLILLTELTSRLKLPELTLFFCYWYKLNRLVGWSSSSSLESAFVGLVGVMWWRLVRILVG